MNKEEYKIATDKIELLLQKATKKGGFNNLTLLENAKLNELSVAVNEYEKEKLPNTKNIL